MRIRDYLLILIIALFFIIAIIKAIKKPHCSGQCDKCSRCKNNHK